MRPVRSIALSIGQQLFGMKRDYPNFHWARSNNLPTWIGKLQPTEKSTEYLVKIVYRYDNSFSKSPSVWVISPDIHPRAPHRYSDSSLCLHYPPDHNWSPNKFISKTTVPWTSLWLAFYEIWLETDRWYGAEVNHSGTSPKRK